MKIIRIIRVMVAVFVVFFAVSLCSCTLFIEKDGKRLCEMAGGTRWESGELSIAFSDGKSDSRAWLGDTEYPALVAFDNPVFTIFISIHDESKSNDIIIGLDHIKLLSPTSFRAHVYRDDYDTLDASWITFYAKTD